MKIDKRIVLLVSLLLLTSCSRNDLSSNSSSISSSSITISSDSLPLSSELSSIVIDPLAYYESELIRLEELKKRADQRKHSFPSEVKSANDTKVENNFFRIVEEQIYEQIGRN